MCKKTNEPSPGFTMVEMVVILGIITLLSAAVLFSFSGLNEGGALNRAIRELALDLREAQNLSLSVRQIQIGSPAVSQIPDAVGIRFVRNSISYFKFSDLAPRDQTYTGASEKVVDSTRSFERNIKINDLTVFSGACPAGCSSEIVNVIFFSPEAAVTITNDYGTIIGDRLDIKISAPNVGQTKTLTLRSSGQITIK